jgi:tetraacyldisaccharide 4'-kinase
LLAFALWPLSLLFCALAWLRRQLYQRGFLRSSKLPVTTIVVGNISLGGNGKTPFVVALVDLLKHKGYRPGILTRGYKSDYEHEITLLFDAKTSERSGDEANMLSQLCACPIAVGADRVQGGKALLQRFPDVDVIVTDDGLQHYALARDIEIIVQRQAANGNGFCLPAGPLREPVRRLKAADIVIDRDGTELDECFGNCWNLLDAQKKCALKVFRGQKVHALAGIGFPDLFFDALRAQGLEVDAHAFADHYAFSENDLYGLNDAPLLVTHKDAVKLKAMAEKLHLTNLWVVPLELTLSDDLQYRLFKLIEKKHNG